MENAGRGDTDERRAGGMSEQRRERVRMEISREAARLFWERGVVETTGEQIAESVGLSVRTIWRYFRNKESCAEPVLARGVEETVRIMRRWPRDISLEDHLVAWRTEHPREPGQEADELAELRMVALAETEPALRTAWLMACDQVERELVGIIADRLRRPAEDLEVRLHAAATNSVLRVFGEDVSAAVVKGARPAYADDPLERIARAVRVATGGAVGDPVGPIHSSREDE